jgi:hypothetical protein
MSAAPFSFSSVRPLVRYVDEGQAVIETLLSIHPRCNPQGSPAGSCSAEVLLEIDSSDGFHDESRAPLTLVNDTARVRFDIVHPELWWPAGMGDQPLYNLKVSLVIADTLCEQRTVTLGLASVRGDQPTTIDRKLVLLINGRARSIASVVVVDRIDENQLLPATGDSLLLVRDHYGPELLYQAADRAGILLVQCVPIHPDGTPEVDVAAQVDRLASHPCLAGWFVGHLGRLSDGVARQIIALDPTRAVFRRFPLPPAA